MLYWWASAWNVGRLAVVYVNQVVITGIKRNRKKTLMKNLKSKLIIHVLPTINSSLHRGIQGLWLTGLLLLTWLCFISILGSHYHYLVQNLCTCSELINQVFNLMKFLPFLNLVSFLSKWNCYICNVF